MKSRTLALSRVGVPPSGSRTGHRLSRLLPVLAIIGMIAGCGGTTAPIMSASNGSTSTDSGRPGTTCPGNPYPPKRYGDIGCLGTTSHTDYTPVVNEPVGLTTCPERRVRIIVPKEYTSEQITDALASAFVDDHVSASSGGGVIFAYYNQTEVNAGTYTAGRLLLDRQCNGGNMITLDAGLSDEQTITAGFSSCNWSGGLGCG